MHTRTIFTRIPLWAAAGAYLLSVAIHAAPLPEAKTGGADGGPITVLFLSTHPQMDGTYKTKLEGEGFVFTNASLYDPFTPGFLRKFNVVVLDKLPYAGEEYGVFGQKLLHYWKNMESIRGHLRDGAGVLVYPNLADCGGALALHWNRAMRPWGVQIRQECVLDRSLGFGEWKAYSKNWYCWTDNLDEHPVTEGLRRIYYASANLRWDDCYTTPPLVCDKNWTPLVKAMPGARLAYDVRGNWVHAEDSPKELTLAAVRAVGKGRLATFAVSPGYIHRLGYLRRENKWYGEMCFGLIDGIVIEKGNGTVPSDTGALVHHLYRWLAGESVKNGFGGYKTGEPVETETTVVTEEGKDFQAVLDFDDLTMPPSWRHRPTHVKIDNNHYFPEIPDALVKGELRYLRALVGAHTSLSDGKGTVEDYARSAQAAGYSVIVFAEAFEHLDREEWLALVRGCERHTTDDFVCLPGIDIMDPDGNHFLIVAPPFYPRKAWLSPDGKRLVQTQVINLMYGDHMVVAHRPETSPLPQERLKHFQGLSVYTYRNGKVVDEAVHAYGWQVMNASNPHPVVVHELFSPEEVEGASKTGFQQILPSDTPRNAAGYFRVGIQHYFEAPSRHLISEGPIVTKWVTSAKDVGPAKENRDRFRVDVGVTGEAPLAEVMLYDGPVVVRRWLPNAEAFEAAAYFRHSRQYSLFVVARDSEGRRTITSSVRTAARRYHFRCSDRQNWLGHVGAYYTGAFLPDRMDVQLSVRGTVEGRAIFTSVPGTSMAMKLNFPFTCNDVVLTESILDEKYVTAGFNDVGLDAMPSRASKVSSVYHGRMRHWSFTPGKRGQPHPTVIEFDLTLKRDVEPANPAGLFPAFHRLVGKKFVQLSDAGKVARDKVDKTTVRDAPRGACAGGFIALSDGLRIDRGRFGVAPAKGCPTVIPAGSRFRARFLVSGLGVRAGNGPGDHFDKDPEAWLKALGFGAETPYTIQWTRGEPQGPDFPLPVGAGDHGIAGSIERTADIPFEVPLEVRGTNRNWAAGIWLEGEPITYTGVFEGKCWPRLDVSKKGRFYAGNLLLAESPDLVLEVIVWSKDRIWIEAHNPTSEPITAMIQTPKEIVDHKALSKTIRVPAGSTVFVDERQ